MDWRLTGADGLKVPHKDQTWHFVRNHVSDLFTATEDEFVEAMKLTWKRMKIVMEPSCAVPLAAILANPEVFRGRYVVAQEPRLGVPYRPDAGRD